MEGNAEASTSKNYFEPSLYCRFRECKFANVIEIGIMMLTMPSRVLKIRRGVFLGHMLDMEVDT